MATTDVAESALSPHTVTGESLTREQLVVLIAAGTQPLVLSHCDLAGADLSRPDLRSAHLKLACFEGADRRDVRLVGLKLLDAKLFKGATISDRQAAELVAELGLNVA